MKMKQEQERMSGAFWDLLKWKQELFIQTLGLWTQPRVATPRPPPEACTMGLRLTSWREKYQVQQEKMPVESEVWGRQQLSRP